MEKLCRGRKYLLSPVWCGRFNSFATLHFSWARIIDLSCSPLHIDTEWRHRKSCRNPSPHLRWITQCLRYPSPSLAYLKVLNLQKSEPPFWFPNPQSRNSPILKTLLIEHPCCFCLSPSLTLTVTHWDTENFPNHMEKGNLGHTQATMLGLILGWF